MVTYNAAAPYAAEVLRGVLAGEVKPASNDAAKCVIDVTEKIDGFVTPASADS